MTPTSNHNLELYAAKRKLLYIFWLLHQTTTLTEVEEIITCCISFDSYIKPQPADKWCRMPTVVYLLTPTSNHNVPAVPIIETLLYIFWLLHQTTTQQTHRFPTFCCISFDSYIKPQPEGFGTTVPLVVYLLTPTSNHNRVTQFSASQLLYIFWLLHQTTTVPRPHHRRCRCISFDSYIKPQLLSFSYVLPEVVYLLTPTSNHNLMPLAPLLCGLYIFWLLHQTTTVRSSVAFAVCCISFDSYIKPQLSILFCLMRWVVYLLTPTSNHNL